MNRETDLDHRPFAHPAAIHLHQDQSALLSVAVAQRAIEEDVLKEFNPFFFSAEISNSRLDSHFTKMAVSSLKNYAADAQAGVSFLHSHNREEIIGRSIGGKFVNGQGNGIARVMADFYTIPGLQVGALSTDQLILGIRSGILNDVSIGFFGGTFVCSICGRDMMRDWDCWHIPGYEEEVEHDAKVEKVIAEATVEDAHLAETSDVFKGSCPGAAITKAQQEAEAGRIRPEARRMIENRYRIHLPEKLVTVPGHKSAEEKRNMGQPTRETDETTASSATPPAPDPPPAPAAEPAVVDPPPAPETAADESRMVGQLRALITQRNIEGLTVPANARVLELALDGLTYRRDLINVALLEGVRAYGANWDQDAYRKTLEASEIAMIKRMTEDFATVAQGKFKGGRITTDGEVENKQPQRKVSRRAFKTVAQ